MSWRWLLGLFLILVGCTDATHPLTSDRGLSLPAGDASRAVAAPTGELSLRVRWPAPPATYQAAAIPYTACSLYLAVTDGDRLLAEALVPRREGQPIATASFHLEGGTPFTVRAEAYREAAPDRAHAVPLARATALGVSVVPSMRTPLVLELVSMAAPELLALSTVVGLPGDLVRLEGRNLGPATHSLEVDFNGTAAEAHRLADDTLEVRVPTGSTTGTLSVRVDNMPLANPPTFWILQDLLFAMATSSWDVAPSLQRLYPGQQTELRPDARFVAAAGRALPWPAPQPTYRLDPPTLGVVVGRGFVAAKEPVQGTVTAVLGAHESRPWQVSVQPLSLQLTPATMDVGPAAQATGLFAARQAFADGTPLTNLVTFDVDATDSFQISTNGLLLARAGVVRGHGMVSIRSQLLPELIATASVVIPYYQVDTVAGTGIAGSSGDGGPALQASIDLPWGMTFGSDGVLYVADHARHQIRGFLPGGNASTVAGNGVRAAQGDGGPATAGCLSYPTDVVMDPEGRLYIADQGNRRIRRVDRNGILSTWASLSGEPYGLGIDARNRLHVGFYTLRELELPTSSDGLPLTTNSRHAATDIVVTRAGVVYSGHDGDYTVRAREGADCRVLSKEYGSTRIPALQSGAWLLGTQFNLPSALALDADERLLIAANGQNQIVRVEADGRIRILAGTGGLGAGGDGGPALLATFAHPRGLAVDASGDIYVADTDNHRIRRLTLKR